MSIISAGTSNTSTLVYTGDTTGAMVFQTNGTTEAMRINASQNVGVGTSSPDYRLTVKQTSGDLQFAMQGVAKNWNWRNQSDGTYGLFDDSIGYWRYMYDTSNNHIWFGTSGSERMRIDSSGRVKMPYQPTFTASLTNGNTGTSGTIVYNSSDINVGGHYNTTNGRFTVPIAGVYMFSITGISVNTTNVEASIMVNGSGTYINARGGSNTNSTAAGYCGVIFISLAVNDYVSVRIEGGAAQYGFGNYTTFSGRLMN